MVQTVSGHQKGRVGSPGFFVHLVYFSCHGGVLVCFSCRLLAQGVSTLVLHPGTVQTRMNKTGILASTSVEGMRARIEEMRSDVCEFMMFDGTRIQW